MMWVLMSIIGLLLVTLASVGLLYGERQRTARMEEKADHAKCMAHLTSVASNRFIAGRLRELAAKYDGIEEQAVLAQLARNRYQPGGPSMPTIWLNLQAELLDPTEFNHNEVALPVVEL
jgi:hypothetical protein